MVMEGEDETGGREEGLEGMHEKGDEIFLNEHATEH